MNRSRENLNLQKTFAAVTAFLFLVKIAAWYITKSVAILTDALEYTINLTAAFISLYSLYLAALPRDENHPYGHGRVEFLSAAIEGLLMIVSSFLILYKAISNLRHPSVVEKLDVGIYLVAFTALANFGVGYYSVQKGKKNNTLVLIATGKHMQTDTYATGGIIVGLVLIYFTGKVWIDSVVSILFAVMILFTGYTILRSSIAGIMDEADKELLDKVVRYLNENRRENWMDLHNLRIIKYGSVLHLDCHLTVPYYFTVRQGHAEMDALEEMIRKSFGESIELFVHEDGCRYVQCPLCFKQDCPVRQHEFKQRVQWTMANVLINHQHTASGAENKELK